MKPSYSLTDIVDCPSCGRRFSITGRGPVFRSCDAYVCSPECSYVRAKTIASIDRNLDNPMSWPMQRSPSSSNINKPPNSTTWRIPEETPLMMGLEDYNSNPNSYIQIDRQIAPVINNQGVGEAQQFAWPIACLLMFAISAIALL